MQSRVLIECAAVCFSAVLDTSASMSVGRSRPLSEPAATIVRAWYESAQSGDRLVRVLECRVFEPRGRCAANAAARFPDRWLPGGPGMAGALDTALRVLPRGAALLVVGDFFDVSTTAASFARAGAKFDCTALVAEDPWTGDLPLRGFTRVRDAETHRTQLFYFGAKQRMSCAKAVRRRHDRIARELQSAGWRTGTFCEESGNRALLNAFGIRAHTKA
ncbi:MAG: hypothetical protein M3Y18_04805 [Candidatus Eremiobacteraeota bacterium]|nr:hypothetical protein [Candidatus Eremiobacteraeota bacterium]